MTRRIDSIDPWLDLLPCEPRVGANHRVAASVRAAIEGERRPWWRSWPIVGVSAAAAALVASFLLTHQEPHSIVPMPHTDAEVAALAELSETLSVISTVQTDYFGTD